MVRNGDASRRVSSNANETQLLNALQVARTGLWQYDVARDLFTFNDQFYAIFGTTAAAVGGYQMAAAEYARRFVHPEDAPLVQRAIQQSLESTDPGYSGELEHRAIFADGSVRHIVARWFIVKDESGRTVTTYGVNRDITDRKHNEQRIAESEARFKSLVEQQIAGIFIQNYDGALAYINPRFATMLGYQPREMIGKPLLSFIAERDRDRVAGLVRERFAGRSTNSPTEFAIRRRDGSLTDALGQSSVATWEGQPALIGVVIDYSEHKQATRAMHQTIQALASTLELRDPYTAGHQQRVARLACAIGRDLGLPESQIEGLELASAVHDIGKVLVPAEILSKPGALTDLEFRMVQQHAEAGFKILQNVEFPWPVAQTVLQHHERLDGSGYPRGLAGDAILLEARILAAADVVDSMMMRRPYREKLGRDAALQELEAGKGRLYDPAVVASCCSLFRDKAFSFDDPRAA
jgi:PAS domain S-box-containing protein